jgi:hypothetical protein
MSYRIFSPVVAYFDSATALFRPAPGLRVLFLPLLVCFRNAGVFEFCTVPISGADLG